MLDWIKEGKVGPWEIKHFEITKEQAVIYTIGCYGSYEIPPSPGMYTKLTHKKRGVIMSDTRQEMMDIYDFDEMLTRYPGLDVHISGLGLGIFTKHALDKGYTVEVIEIDPDVIQLVGSQLLPIYNEKLTIINANALEWRPPKGKRYGVVWHDIWDDANLDNLEQYKLLMRRWGHWARVQGAWGYDWIHRIQREGYRRW